MITEDYVSFEVAKLLKEKGFDECCRAFITQNVDFALESDGRVFNHILLDNEYAAPTFQMVMKWLRNIHGLFIHIDVIREASCWLADIQDIKEDVNVYPVKDDFSNYEEACEAAIKYCLENLINY